MCRMCFQGTRRASKGIKQIANCSLHEDIFNQSGWMIMQYLARYWIRHAGTGVFTHKTKRSSVWNEYLESERTMNSQRIVDLKQAIQARYARKYGPVTLHSEEFKAATENVTRIRYTMRKEDGSFLRFIGRAAYADQHIYLGVHQCTDAVSRVVAQRSSFLRAAR